MKIVKNVVESSQKVANGNQKVVGTSGKQLKVVKK